MKRVVLVLLVLVGVILLTGCYVVFTVPAPPTTPPITPSVQNCYLTITAGYWVWGGIYANDQYVGEIDFQTNPTVTISVPCNTWVTIYIVDPCGYKSHTEYIYITRGMNYLSFDYW